jgi:hypothetical protein
MRMARVKPKGRDVVYHCVSRIVGGQRLIGAVEKEKFRKDGGLGGALKGGFEVSASS